MKLSRRKTDIFNHSLTPVGFMALFMFFMCSVFANRSHQFIAICNVVYAKEGRTVSQLKRYSKRFVTIEIKFTTKWNKMDHKMWLMLNEMKWNS